MRRNIVSSLMNCLFFSRVSCDTNLGKPNPRLSGCVLGR